MPSKEHISNTPGEQSYIAEKGGCESKALSDRYAVRITNAVKNTILGDVNTDPIAKQYIPQAKELNIKPEELLDPIGDETYTPVKGIVHRHPDRVLFKPANVCAVYCRYCFRREHIGPGSDILNKEERTAALDYIRNHKEIWEVILTGGDPLVLSARHLKEILSELDKIEHVQIIRIHTRVPIADPARITKDLLKTLSAVEKPLYTVLHINHAQEISPAVKTALEALRSAGSTLLTQSVLLKGVNDSVNALETLFRTLVTLHVKPYYLHHPDLAPGTSHFRLSIKEGQALMHALQGRISGLCLPTYILDIPGGHGKVPINPAYHEALEANRYMIEDPKGINHHYPPEE